MQVTLKLFASLGQYLPPGAVQNTVAVETAEGTTVRALLDHHNVPLAKCHLILVNGIYQPPARSADVVLNAGDILACWPPVAGG
jgi:molybdopterin converting factor small subunit